MGDGSLRCLGCQGKFGPLFADLRCELCCLSFRLQDILHSDRFPEIGGKFITPDIRGVYYKALEICDGYSRQVQGGSVPPGTGVEAPSGPVAEELKSTTPKAKPPVKEETPSVPKEVKVVKEEKKSPRRSIEKEPYERTEDRKRERRRRDSRESQRERARSSGVRRRRERSRSSRQRRGPSKERKRPRGVSQDKRSPLPRDRRVRSPLRPKSPPGPPPPRLEGHRWQGPIPAYRPQAEEPAWALMPPKIAHRPAAALGGRPRAKGKAKAEARGERPRVRGVLRRPAGARGDEDLGEQQPSEVLEEGREVEAWKVGLASWKMGKRLIVTEGSYWEEPVKVAGVVKGLRVEEDQAYLSFKIEGTQSEGLVRWAGGHPGVLADIHLCPSDCAKISKDGLIHANRVKLPKADEREAWMENLIDSRAPAEGEEDEMRRVREEMDKRRPREERESSTPIGPKEAKDSSGSEDEKKRKKKKKKKKAEREKLRMVATKDLTTVFGTTGLDPRPSIRKRVRKRAMKAARKRGRKVGSSSTSSSGTSSATEGSIEDSGRLFGEEVKVKMVGKRFPGALTLSTLEMMQETVVSQTGQPWNLDRSALPPIFSQYWRMMLSVKMTGAMKREAQTLCYLQDLLLQGRIAATCDGITQRLKGLEQIADGSHFLVAQRQELVPVEVPAMTSPQESLEASRLHREEARAKSASARPWTRSTEWERREDSKGKGKNKDSKGKGKNKGDRGGASKEERDKDKK
eukprot:s758_g24.t1